MESRAGLIASGVCVTLDHRRVLDDVDLHVAPGEVVSLRGPSGAGKSTLLRALVRLVPIAAGAITLDGVDVEAMAAPDLRRRVALVTQHPFMLEGSVADNLRYGVGPLDDAAVVRTLDSAGLTSDFAPRRASELSGGERARVAIARALTRDPAVVLLDEPTAALDAVAAARIERLLGELAQRGLGVCLTSHDPAFAQELSVRTVEL